MPIIGRGQNQYGSPAGDRSGLIPIDYSNQIIQMATESSMALSTFRQVRMPTQVQHLPVLDVLPIAHWVNGEPDPVTGLGGEKATTNQLWKGLVLTAEEIAAIVVVPEAVLEDISINLWGEVAPRIAESISAKLDAAVFAGMNKPASWPAAIIPAATLAGHVANPSGAYPTQDDYDTAISFVEQDGFPVDQVYASINQRSVFRRLNAKGDPIYLTSIRDDGRVDSIYGVPVRYDRFGVLGANSAVLGDPSMAIIGTRTDIQYRVLDQATIDISDAQNGSAVIHLAQQDSVALRVRARFGYAVANPVTHLAPNSAQRYPFAVIGAGSGGGSS